MTALQCSRQPRISHVSLDHRLEPEVSLPGRGGGRGADGAYGVDRLRTMPIDVFPEFAPPRVQIQTEGPGMSAAEVEELITIPMEQALRGVAGPRCAALAVRSRRCPSIQMVFKLGTDLLRCPPAGAGAAALAIPNLPLSAGMPVMLPPLSATSRVMQIGISSKTMSLMDLSMAAFWNMQFRLMRVPGVANVAIWGYRNKQLLVQVDPERLRAHGVTLDKVHGGDVGSARLRAAQVHERGQDAHRRLHRDAQSALRHPPRPAGASTPEDLAQVPIKSRPTARRAHRRRRQGRSGTRWPLIGDAVINDGPGLLMIVEKFPWANTLEVTRGLEKALDELKPGLPGIEIDSEIFRPATFVEQSFDNLTHALLLGALLVVLVLVAFLFEWRVALISLVAIPLSLVAAGLVLYWQGATHQHHGAGRLLRRRSARSSTTPSSTSRTSCGACRQQSRAAGQQQVDGRVILDASLEVRRPIVYATLIIVLSVMPVFFMDGLSGAFFSPLAIAYCLALLASMVVALTVTPALALILLRNAPLATRESAAGARGSSAATSAVLARVDAGAARGRSATAAVIAAAGRARLAAARPVAAAGFQGARLPDALGDASPAPRTRDVPHHAAGQPGTARHPGRAQFRLPHRARDRRRRARRHELHRELDQRRSERRLRQDAGAMQRGGRAAIPASIAMCRPTSRSASRR